MADGEKTKLSDLTHAIDAADAEMEYHPSIKALVRFLARRAAERDYAELLEVLKSQSDNIIETAGKEKT